MPAAAPASVHTSPKLFLSYAHADRARVQELYQRLTSNGFSVWMDIANLRAGSQWEKEIQQAINEADAVLICLSRNSTSRIGFLQKEMAVVFKVAETKANNFIIPVRLEESPVPTILEPLYYVDLFAKDGYERLLNTLYTLERDASALPDNPSIETSSSTKTESDAAVKRARPPSAGADDPNDLESLSPQVGITRISPIEAVLAGGIDIAIIGTGFQPGAQVLFDSYQSAEVSFDSSHQVRAKLPGATEPGQVSVKIVNPDGTSATLPRVFRYVTTMVDSDPAEIPSVEQQESATEQSIKEGLAEEARERNALNDKPIDNLNLDKLGFADYVLALRDFISSQSTTTPLSISINGAWGSGKSSLMRMLQKQLEPELPTGLWRIQLQRLAGQFWKTLFGREQQLEPKLPARLWRIQLQWLAGRFWGSFFWRVGQVLMIPGRPNSDYIKLGLAFDPPEDVTSKNFEELLGKFVDYSLKGSPLTPAYFQKERELRLKRTRFWARQAARRRKMTPQRHPTVWFNAWKFNEQEQLWAALATAVLSQLKQKYGFFARLVFVSQLTFRRTDKLGTLKQVGRKFAVPITLAAIVAVYQMKRGSLPAYLNLSSLSGPWSWLSDRLVWLAPVLAAMWQALKAIDDPFKLPSEHLIDQPNYREKIGFIGTFEEDFQRIVRIAVRRSIFWQPRKLVIFIDDLDRCSPTQTAGIVEAINLFLDSVGCVFILGMDMSAVAISIEVKYKDLAERMRAAAPDSISPGVLFLDKIVQIPFNVPRPNKSYIHELVGHITEPPRRELPIIRPPLTDASLSQSAPPRSPQPTLGSAAPAKGSQTPAGSSSASVRDRAGFAQSDIREAIAFASNLLKENPRQVKRFINLFRLQVYVAHERGMLSDEKEFGLTPRKLAVWVAWYMQWPDIMKLLSSPANTRELRVHLAHISEKYLALVNSKDPDAGWQFTQPDVYIKDLTEIRASQSDAVVHWSKLPWPLWIRDFDFLQCLKELERYWREPEHKRGPDLLESILDMTHVTVSQSPASTPALQSPEKTAAISNPPPEQHQESIQA